MLVTMKEMLADAKAKKYAIPAFDVSNYEMIKAVIDVCEEERSPALFMCLKPDMQNKGIKFITAMLREAAENYTVPVCIHLDHATDIEDIKEAIDNNNLDIHEPDDYIKIEEVEEAKAEIKQTPKKTKPKREKKYTKHAPLTRGHVRRESR